MSLVILFHFLCAQYVSDTNISIIRSLRLCCWITTSVVLFSVRCVLDIWLVLSGARFAGFGAAGFEWCSFRKLKHNSVYTRQMKAPRVTTAIKLWTWNRCLYKNAELEWHRFAVGSTSRFTVTCSASSNKRSVYVRAEEFNVKYASSKGVHK